MTKPLWIGALLLAIATAQAPWAGAAGTNAKDATDRAPAHSSRKKLHSFSEFGSELGKIGRKIGHGAADAGKGAAAKIERDVKHKNFKPHSPDAPDSSVDDRAGTP
ncbi:MAG: hypothetical protein GC151_18315 [Betaproteobacteria bacterium]|nr:hypothetical protein [Betaproteobacteria bacterium]